MLQYRNQNFFMLAEDFLHQYIKKWALK